MANKQFGRFDDGESKAKPRRRYFTKGAEERKAFGGLDDLRSQSGLGHLFTAPRFDWYQVTFHDNVQAMDVLESAYRYFPECTMQVAQRVEVKQYARGVNVYHHPGLSKERLFHFCIGGSGGDRPHIKATGAESHLVYEWLSSEWAGSYGVSRADVCMDTTEPDMFQYLDQMSVSYCTLRKLALSRAGDWDNWVAGATRYMGSKDSQAQCRIYEKGKQLGGNKDWVRLEFQIRPSKAADKRAVALMTPEKVALSVPWCATFMFHLMHAHDAKPGDYQQIGTVWKQTDDQRRIKALMHQYGGFLTRLAESLPGGWGDVGLMLQMAGDIAKETRRAKGGIGPNPYDVLISKLLAG